MAAFIHRRTRHGGAQTRNVAIAPLCMLVRIARRLGLDEKDVAQLEALLRTAARGPSGAGRPTSKQRIDDAYEALGITPDADTAEIKLAYRRLMNENHPDKLAARGHLTNRKRNPHESHSLPHDRGHDRNSAAPG